MVIQLCQYKQAS